MEIKFKTCLIILNLIASTTNAPIAAMQHENKDIFALQFHPEVTHTNDGHVILNNFIFNVCSAKARLEDG